MADEKQQSFGPYELIAGVNSLLFGADPVVELVRGKRFSTKEPAIAAFLDENPHVRKAKAAPKKSKAKAAPKVAAAPDSDGTA